MKPDALTRLIARSVGHADVIQPVRPSRFEPPAGLPALGTGFGGDTGRETSAASPLPAAVVARGPSTASGAVRDFSERPAQAVGREQPAAPVPRPLAHAISAAAPPPSTSPAPLDSRGGRRDEDARHRTPDIRRGAAAVRARVSAQPPSGESIARADEQRIVPAIAPIEVGTRPAEAPAAAPGRPERAGVRETVPPARDSTVTVHIGRIEVRAIVAPAAEPKKQAPDNRQRLSLSDYLQRRRKGGR